MNKKILFSLVVLLNVFLLGFESAYACSCLRMTPCEAYSRAKIVFTGRITKAVDGQNGRRHQVQVEENFLGMENTQLVDVFTDQSTSCAFSMQEGAQYLIFAWRNEETGKLWTGMCSHTAQLEYAKEDLEYLRSVKSAGKKGATIEGAVLDAEKSEDEPKKPAAIDKVLVENANGQKYEADIAPDGKYRLSGLSAGKYKIFVTLPEGLITGEQASAFADDENMYPEFVEVAGHGCTVKNFDVKTNGVIGGRVTGADGLPLEEKSVKLFRLPDPNKPKKTAEINANTEESGANADESETIGEPANEAAEKADEPEAEEFEADYDAYTDENGFYSFKGLPPGRYLLGVGIDRYLMINHEGGEYLPTYFPNARKKENAVVIELKKAEVLTDKNIQLPPKLKKRKITGQIVFKNNKPTLNVRSAIYARRDSYSNADWVGDLEADAKGNFSFEAYEETDYLIKAWIEKPLGENSTETTHSSKCFMIPKNGAVKPLKIILEIGSANCDESAFRDR